jgi:predicted HicB family RNase H-like nuclease
MPRKRTEAQIKSEKRRDLKYKSFGIRVKVEMMEEIKIYCSISNISIHQFIIDAIKEKLGRRK